MREVSEDYIYDTLEFNEFLQMMAKQQNNVHTREDVKGAFRIFDDDDDGCIHAQDLVEVKKHAWVSDIYFALMIPAVGVDEHGGEVEQVRSTKV